ncbi:MAG: DNA oxidative demethylase AlkB [Azonexus sp.]
MSGDLFATQRRAERLGPGTVLLHAFACAEAGAVLGEIEKIIALAPFRRMQTPGGHHLSVAMSNCGELGWLSDAAGYSYVATDPQSGLPWPAMPDLLRDLAGRAAAAAGFAGFVPDACLINRYVPGAKMALHQDRDERDLAAPIVSLSLGLPAVFLFGGLARRDKPGHLALEHGDVLVWGGPDRLRFHGVLPVKEGCHPLLGGQRLNLTFRKAG